jgi:hypothetical protein
MGSETQQSADIITARKRKREIDVLLADIRTERQSLKKEISSLSEKLNEKSTAPRDRVPIKMQRSRRVLRTKALSEELKGLMAEKKGLIDKIPKSAKAT